MFKPKNYFNASQSLFAELFQVENTWEALPNIASYIISQFESGKITANYNNQKYVYIGENSVVQDNALITGPAIIGSNCIIAHASLIRENCLIDNNVFIGHAAEIKNSIILSGTRVAHLNYIGDSVIGNNVNFAGGAMCANFRFDKKNVSVKISNEQKIDTGLEKFGSIIGDNSSIGSNVVLNPGTILGKNCIVYPLTPVIGVYKDGAVIK